MDLSRNFKIFKYNIKKFFIDNKTINTAYNNCCYYYNPKTMDIINQITKQIKIEETIKYQKEAVNDLNKKVKIRKR